MAEDSFYPSYFSSPDGTVIYNCGLTHSCVNCSYISSDLRSLRSGLIHSTVDCSYISGDLATATATDDCCNSIWHMCTIYKLLINASINIMPLHLKYFPQLFLIFWQGTEFFFPVHPKDVQLGLCLDFVQAKYKEDM